MSRTTSGAISSRISVRITGIATGRYSKRFAPSWVTRIIWARCSGLSDPRLLLMSSFLVDYPFADRLYPGALDVLAHLGQWGPTVILSDGDVVFQPRKVQRSGLWQAVEGRVLIYIHKEQMVDEIVRRHPARHYVMVDDKLRILASMKKILGDRLTTVFPRQGHYAHDPKNLASYPPADLSIDRIGDLLHYAFSGSRAFTKIGA